MDLSKKLIELRKHQRFSQEELAEKLNVSRQTITKWEMGAQPAIDYLVKLCQLYGCTLDELVQTSCHPHAEGKKKPSKDWIKFLIDAKKNTYAAQKNKTTSSRLMSADYAYEKGCYRYLDSFVGSQRFSGQEIVWENEMPIWSMNYYGSVWTSSFSSDFLKEALMNCSLTNPYRGPQCYCRGKYSYIMDVSGNIDYFQGKEIIWYEDEKTYECYFHGGILE